MLCLAGRGRISRLFGTAAVSDVRVSRAAVAGIAAMRLPGYQDAVMAAATHVDEQYVWLTREAYDSLRERYRVKDEPSFLQKAANFANAAAHHISSGMPAASEEQVAQRFEICRSCEFYRDSTCMKCGCPVVREKRFLSKLAWADQSCPVGKWGPVTPGQS